MRILVATFTYFPNLDGVAEAARTMVENFTAAGHEVSVVTGPSSSLAANGLTNDAPIHRFDISGSAAPSIGFTGEIQQYREFIRSYSPDVIIFHGWETWPIEVVRRELPYLRSKSVLLSHGYSVHMLELQILPRGLFKWFRWLPYVCALPRQLRSIDRVVFLSHKRDFGRFFDAKIAKWLGCNNTTVIPNSVNADLNIGSTNLRKQIGAGDGVLYLCVANYSLRKNQGMALEAFIKAHIPGSSLVFIGSSLGDYGRELQNQWSKIQSRYPEISVYFLEKFSRPEVVSAFKCCDVLLLSATAETQPIVILEAMACSKPFISTDTGCVSELQGGVVVSDVSDMALHMRRLAENVSERDALGQLARKYFETHHAPEVTNRAWLDLIYEITDETAVSKNTDLP